MINAHLCVEKCEICRNNMFTGGTKIDFLNNIEGLLKYYSYNDEEEINKNIYHCRQ